MVWAALVAFGVAIVSMTIFGARLTKRHQDAIVDSLEDEVDPSDPWAAWKPRPFEEHESRPHPRVWPILASLVGLVFVGAGFAGARNGPDIGKAELAAPVLPTPSALTVDVEVTPVPTAKPPPPTPQPVLHTATPTQASATKPAAAATSSEGPLLSGSAGCAAGKMSVSYSATARGSKLFWLAVYMDGSIVKGGPISGTSINGSATKQAAAGAHALEVSVQDKAGHTARKQFQTHCG